MAYISASACWTDLDSVKQPLLQRCENYASLTIPKLCLPQGFEAMSTDQTHDYQSIGAQAVNHLTNKMMLALFAPTRPFFRSDLGKKTRAELAAKNIDPNTVVASLGQIERDAIKVLDERAQRPKLYTTMRHLIVTGNVLLCMYNEAMRVMGIRYYCVKRTATGKLHTLIIKERLKFNELEQPVKDVLPAKYHDDTEVDHYRWIQLLDSGDYEMSQWVDETILPRKFNGKWSEANLPYRVLTWDLADESDYGTGLVEEYAGDLEALSTLSEAVVNGAVLGTEYRWLVKPTGMTSADDLNNSRNGDALPGSPDDIAPTQGGNPQAITVADKVIERYERRVAFGFLMNSLVTRDAERVTAEEIRITAQELETAFGGVYSALAASVQLPVAHWLLKAIDVKIAGTDITITVVTGLDALSRSGDLENLRLAFGDLTAVFAGIPPELQGRLKFKALTDYIGNGRGIDLSPFIKSDEEFAKYVQEQQAARVQESNATEAGAATAQAVANQGTQ
jgi:Bacteriophage head to tail connecting protein